MEMAFTLYVLYKNNPIGHGITRKNKCPNKNISVCFRGKRFLSKSQSGQDLFSLTWMLIASAVHVLAFIDGINVLPGLGKIHGPG